MRAYHRARPHTRGMAILRLTRVPRGTSGVGVRAEGTVVGEFAGLLEQECATALREFGAVDLDLAGVTYVDASGVVALQRLERTKITISNCPPLIRELMEDEGAP